MKTPWASISRIEIDGVHSGTGFLIGPGYVVTALHVVATPEGRPVGEISLFFNTHAEFEDNRPIFQTTATLIPELWSQENDFAVLRCASAPVGAKPLVLTDRCRQYRDIAASGFATQDPAGFTLTGKIASLNEPTQSGSPALGLQLDAGSGVQLKGHSGAPVISDRRVVALLRTAHLDGQDKSAGGLVQATSIRHVVECCNHHNPGLLRYHSNIRWPAPGGAALPVVADRKPEFRQFESIITGASAQRILLIKGESGVGKSRITEAFEQYARGLAVTVASIRLEIDSTMDGVFDSLVFSAGGELFAEATAASGTNRFLVIINELVTCDRPFLLMIDNWQMAKDNLRRWVEQQLFPQLDRMPHVAVMITGQQVPDHRGAQWNEIAEVRELGLIQSPDDWMEFCHLEWPGTKIVRDYIAGILFASEQKMKPNEVYIQLASLHRHLQATSGAGAGR
jgi:hypothetical protein